jgi:uncharacterized protein
MITITIERSEAGRIRRFYVSGHAKYNDPGKDIVCAGVSAITVGAVNAVEKLTGLVPEAEMREGWLAAEAPYSEDQRLDGQAQLLLEGMIVALESIADEYAKYVKIKELFS